jgi:small subunit ribosomal protein S21
LTVKWQVPYTQSVRTPGAPGFLKQEGVNSLAQVQVRQNESLDQALRRFKKQIQQSGILKEAREHEHYEKPSDKKRKAAAASRRKRLNDLRKMAGR